jgi:hypothetical protein
MAVHLVHMKQGACQALYERITKNDREKGVSKGKPFLDIVAGTSIGALKCCSNCQICQGK